MADRLPTDDELDALIDAALRTEPMLPVPPGLHRKIQDRVHFADLQERERVRFRYSLLSAVCALLILFSGTGVIVMLTNFSIVYHHGVSGGKGFLDYYLNRLDVSWAGHVGTYTLMLTLGLSVASLWGGLILFRGHTRQFRHRVQSLSGSATDAVMREAQ